MSWPRRISTVCVDEQLRHPSGSGRTALSTGSPDRVPTGAAAVSVEAKVRAVASNNRRSVTRGWTLSYTARVEGLEGWQPMPAGSTRPSLLSANRSPQNSNPTIAASTRARLLAVASDLSLRPRRRRSRAASIGSRAWSVGECAGLARRRLGLPDVLASAAARASDRGQLRPLCEVGGRPPLMAPASVHPQESRRPLANRLAARRQTVVP